MAEQSIGALWIKSGAKGDYLTGTLELEGKDGEKIRVVAFRETNKRNPKGPDWKLFKAKTRDEAAPGPHPSNSYGGVDEPPF